MTDIKGISTESTEKEKKQDVLREWFAPEFTILHTGKTAGGANPNTTEGTGGPGGGYFNSMS